jgi:hypothetical protein
MQMLYFMIQEKVERKRKGKGLKIEPNSNMLQCGYGNISGDSKRRRSSVTAIL